MPNYKIHKRKSMIDKDTTIVNVTKEKTLSETLFGENEKDKKGLKDGTYTIHERNSILDKNEKIVTINRQKPLSETLFESDDNKQKQENQKENYSNYVSEQNQKMMNDYNDLVKMERKYTDQQRYNNKVVGEEYTEGISKTELNNAMNSFDYASASLDKKKDYLIFVAKLFNAIDKGYSVDYVKLEKKKVPAEVNLILRYHKINLEKINYKLMLILITCVTSFIIALNITVIYKFTNSNIVIILVTVLVSLPIALVCYDLIGKHFEKQSK